MDFDSLHYKDHAWSSIRSPPLCGLSINMVTMTNESSRIDEAVWCKERFLWTRVICSVCFMVDLC